MQPSTKEKTQDSQLGLLHPVVIPTVEPQCDWCDYEAARVICCVNEPKLSYGYNCPHTIQCPDCGDKMHGDDHEEIGRLWDQKKRQPEYAI